MQKYSHMVRLSTNMPPGDLTKLWKVIHFSLQVNIKVIIHQYHMFHKLLNYQMDPHGFSMYVLCF
jgi:hypothetical protein